MINIAIIDQTITQQGRFCLLDWLLHDNFFLYSDYEAWRYGTLEFITDKLSVDLPTLNHLFEETDKQCLSLGLSAAPQQFSSWSNNPKHLPLANKDAQCHQQLTQVWLRPQDQPQLDLFMDNSAQLAEAGLLRMLSNREFHRCQQQLHSLSELNAQCARLGAYQDLINYGLHMLATPVVDKLALMDEQQGLKNEVAPLARDILGADARDYLSYAWRRLANSMQGYSFSSEQPQLHISAALMEIPDYPALINTIQTDNALICQPVLLERLSIALEALRDIDQTLVVWCLMMEQDSTFTSDAIEHNRTSTVFQLWIDFWDENDEWGTHLFPAYVLLKKPAIIHALSNFPPLKHDVTRSMIALLQARIRGENEIELRAQLQGASPELLKLYLS